LAQVNKILDYFLYRLAHSGFHPEIIDCSGPLGGWAVIVLSAVMKMMHC